MVFGKQDTHVDRAGRTLIRETMDEAGVTFNVSPTMTSASVWLIRYSVQFFEVQAQHAFIRDESSKGRWDAALSRSLFSMMMELFTRTVARDLGPRQSSSGKVEHVC